MVITYFWWIFYIYCNNILTYFPHDCWFRTFLFQRLCGTDFMLITWTNSNAVKIIGIRLLKKTDYRKNSKECSSYPFPPRQVESVQRVFHHVMIKIRKLFLRSAACLTSTLLETGVGANDCNCSCTNSLTCLPKHGGIRGHILVTHPMTDIWEICLASAFTRQAQ
jgi:hypothetical protein